MKNNILLVTIVAVITAVGTVGLLHPTMLLADDESAGLSPEIITPMLEVNGCQLTLAIITDADAQPGDPLRVLLTVTNTTDEPVEFSAMATMSSRRTESVESVGRSMPMLSMLWQETVEISLGAQKTTTIELTTNYTVADGSGASLWLQVGDEIVTFNPVVAPIVPVEETPVDVPTEELPDADSVTL